MRPTGDALDERAEMMKRLIGFGVMAAALAAAMCAQAADMPRKAPPMPMEQPLNWGGCYAGADIGYAWGRDRDTETALATGVLSPFSPTDTVAANGPQAGGYLGCNWQWSSAYVIGVEGDLDWVNARGTVTFPNSGPPLNFYDTRVDNQSSVRGRIGYAFDRLLLYATVGGAFAHITEHDVVGATGQFSDTSATRSGLTAGAGVDIALTERWLLRIDYRYTNFGTIAYNSSVFPGVNENHKISENVVRWGASYKFW
jgi:outer membrane immunogenic protein